MICLNLLVVDDEVLIRDVVKTYSEKEGFNVFEAENGIAYRNVEEYLKNDISDFSLEQAMDNNIQNGMDLI